MRLSEAPGVVKFVETGSGAVVAAASESRTGKPVWNECRISVSDDGKALGMESGNSYAMMWLCLMPGITHLKMAKKVGVEVERRRRRGRKRRRRKRKALSVFRKSFPLTVGLHCPFHRYSSGVSPRAACAEQAQTRWDAARINDSKCRLHKDLAFMETLGRHLSHRPSAGRPLRCCLGSKSQSPGEKEPAALQRSSQPKSLPRFEGFV